MKKTIWCAMLCSALLVTACSKDTDDKLEGRWQLREVTANSLTEKVDTVFYNFQTSLFMYQIYDTVTDKYLNMYGYKTVEENNRLFLIMNGSANSIQNFLPRTDWDAAEKEFTIEKITGSRLVLNSEGKRYTFRKF